jgi:pimeloyl-ACP methyl ester carboxylesterase
MIAGNLAFSGRRHSTSWGELTASPVPSGSGLCPSRYTAVREPRSAATGSCKPSRMTGASTPVDLYVETPTRMEPCNVTFTPTAGRSSQTPPSAFRTSRRWSTPPAGRLTRMNRSARSSVDAFNSKSEAPAWKTIPSWYLVTTQDNAIPPATQLFMAKRADARITEVSSSHVVMYSHPDHVVDIILQAAESIN